MTLFDIPVRSIGFDEAVALIQACIRQGGSNTIFMLNAHAVNVAHADPEYRAVLRNATHVFPDGVGVRVAGLLAGRKLRPELNPTDLYPRLCRALEGTGTRVFFLGCEPGVAEKAGERALANHPGLHICGTHHGYFSLAEEAGVIEAIRKAGTDLLLVGLGIPKQEKWIAKRIEATGAKVAMGVGALFEYHAGRAKRAPLWMRRLGLEWLGRLIPGRGAPRRLWRRYLFGNIRFLWLAMGYALQERWRSFRATPLP